MRNNHNRFSKLLYRDLIASFFVLQLRSYVPIPNDSLCRFVNCKMIHAIVRARKIISEILLLMLPANCIDFAAN